MAVTNNLKPMVDLPFFELTNQAPLATLSVSGMTSAETGDTPFIYYMSTSTLYRYDTVGDTWQQLATPPTAPSTILKMRYTRRRGFHGRVISSTSTSVVIASPRGGVLNNQTISLEYGLGSGQERTLSFVREIVHDNGVVTGVTTTTITDTTKKWKVNQWAGYMLALNFGTGVTQYKRIIYNSTDTLTVSDTTLQPQDPWSSPFVSSTPYALPVTTAGSQTHYQIMSSEFSVSAWDVIPDNTTFFTVLTGGIYLVSSAASTPFFTLQYYDVALDQWTTKTVPQGLLPAALGTDVALERTGKIGTPFVSQSGTVTAPNSRSLSDTGLNLTNDRYANHRIFITSGSGRGQNRRIVAHTSGTFTVARDWNVLPNGSQYQIWPDSDRLYMGGSAQSAMYAYSPESDYWMQGQSFDDGVASNITATLSGWVPISVSLSARIASGVQAINPIPTAGGSGYTIGDVLTCSVGGTGAQVIVTAIAAGGVVTQIELVHVGTVTGFTVGTGRATTGGTGTGCTIEITQVGPVATITTNSSHFFKTGNIVTFAGCTEAAWNTAHTIVGCPGTTTFCVVVTATSNMTAANSQSTTVIVDPSKNWIVNEHVGRIVHLMAAGTAPASQIRWITANTATTLTVNTITAASPGQSKYVIYDSKAFGNDTIARVTGRENYGWATGSGQGTTTLVDTTKSWVPNQWSGSLFRIEAGTGYGSGRITITSNSTSSLTYATQTFTPDSSTKYEIADSWGLVSTAGSITTTTDSSKNWPINYWAGKRVRVTAGTTGQNQETTITSNTSTVLTTATITAVSADAAYCIISIPVRGTATEFIWTHGASDSNKKGRYMYYPRGGGSNTFDIFDITTGTFTFGVNSSPQTEGYTTGTSYTYDGVDTIYFSRSATGAPIRIFKYNINTNTFRGGLTTTFLQGTVHAGNLMEIVSTADGLEYIYCLQNAGTLMARALLF